MRSRHAHHAATGTRSTAASGLTAAFCVAAFFGLRAPASSIGDLLLPREHLLEDARALVVDGDAPRLLDDRSRGVGGTDEGRLLLENVDDEEEDVVELLIGGHLLCGLEGGALREHRSGRVVSTTEIRRFLPPIS